MFSDVQRHHRRWTTYCRRTHSWIKRMAMDCGFVQWRSTVLWWIADRRQTCAFGSSLRSPVRSLSKIQFNCLPVLNRSVVITIFNNGTVFCSMTSWDVARLTARIADHNIHTNAETQHMERKIKRVVRHRGFDMRTLVCPFQIYSCNVNNQNGTRPFSTTDNF